jgi:methylenetetrahydrofolate dehydrogenase (NADP+) / methenyltetrahydrofolate cyclohydrolase
MTARIIDGKVIASELRARVATEVARVKAENALTPGLAVVLVGSDPASQVYVRSKHKQTQEAGMASFEHVLPADVAQSDLLALIGALNRDPAVHGILVQLPLPKSLDTETIINAIDPAKDVDGLHPNNAGRLAAGGFAALSPCTPLGCIILTKSVHASLEGMNAIVIGRSNLVGRPLVQLLLNENATVTIAHSRSRDLAQLCARADLVYAAVGKPEMVRGDWIKPGATVIDVGINRLPGVDGKTRLVGDVAFAEASSVAGAITPVPGGVGQMTVACLLVNTLRAACAIRGLPKPAV